MVDHNETVSLSAVATLDPHTPHDVTVSLGATARSFFSYGDHPQIPNNKMVYELDGTTVRYLRAPNGGGGEASASPWTEYLMTNAEIRALNNWGPGRYPHDNPYESYRYMFIFPEPRDIDYVCLSSGLGGGVGGNQYWRFYWSSNTTNGEDGTWTQVSVSTHQLYTSNYFLLRKRAYTDHLNLTNVRGVKMSIDHTLALMGNDGGRPHLIHLYGDKSVDSNRLALWHPTLDQEVSGDWFDWYNFEYGDDTRQFRIKNVSPTKRALNITVSMDSTNDSWNPAISTYHSLYNGGTWGTSISIDILASNAISSVYTLKRSFPPGSPSMWFTMRLKAVAGVWETYIHNVTTATTTYATASGSLMREHNTAAELIAGHTITDGKLYRSGDDYRSLVTYRGSKTTQSHAASGTFTAGGGTADGYLEEFIDAYGSTGLSAAAYILNKKATVSMSAGPAGDNYNDIYTDSYGNDGLYAVATVT